MGKTQRENSLYFKKPADSACWRFPDPAEPTEILGNDLLERLKSAKNRAEIAILLIETGNRDLVYTVIEDMVYGCQILIDKYCVKEG